MASSKELRARIKSIKNTSKVTKAMELVSAAKMARAQNQALAGRAYSTLINNVLASIAPQIDPNSHRLLINDETGDEAVLLVSTNRGLCGALNSNLFRQALSLEGNLKFISVGKKGTSFISKTNQSLIADFELLEKPTLSAARTISKFLIEGFLKGDFIKVHVVYTDFKSTLKQEAVFKQLLPIINQRILESLVASTEIKSNEYLFEPNPDQVLETILPHYLEMEIYQILLEASASEHSARMVAMKNASDNAEELVDDITLDYNQLRQATITNELLDITTASVALE